MNIRQKTLNGYKWNLIFTIISVCIQVLQVYYTAKFLSPEDFGVWGIIVLVLGFVMIFNDVGIGGAIIHQQNLSRKHLSSLYWLTILVGSVLALITILLIPIIEYFFHLKDIAKLFIILSISIIVISIGKQFEIFFQKDLRFKLLSIIDSISLFVGFGFIILLLNFDFKVYSLVIGFLINSIIKTTFLVCYGLREHKPLLYFNISEIKGYIKFGLFQLGEKNINFFSERFDQIIIGRILGSWQLGLYNFSFNLISQPISRINPIINKVSLPLFAKIQDNTSDLKSIYFKTLKVLVYVNGSLLLGLLAVSDTLVLLVFGVKWQQSIFLLQILSIVTLLRSIWNPLGSLLLALGKASWGFYWNIILLIITVPTTLLSSLGGHVNHIGISLICIQMVLFFPSYLLLMKPLLGNCFKDFINSLTNPLLISITMSGIVYWTGKYIKEDFSITFTTLFLQIIIGCIVQSLLIVLFDKKAIGSIVAFIKPNKNNTN